jgi:DNA-binding protein HU-beta
MTKNELSRVIANKTNVNVAHVSVITETLYGVIKHEVAQGNRITFKGFGTFFPKKRAAKKVQLFQEKKTITLSEHYIPAFMPSEALLAKN